MQYLAIFYTFAVTKYKDSRVSHMGKDSRGAAIDSVYYLPQLGDLLTM